MNIRVALVVLSLTPTTVPLLADPISPPTTVGVANTVPSSYANQILEELHRTNASEIEMGKLAQAKAISPSVQAFAQTLVTDHEEAQKKVTNVASDRNVSIGQSNEASSGQTATTYKDDSISRLNTLKGAEFDRLYLKQMIDGHTKVIKTLRGAESKLGNAKDVQKLVTELIPVYERHLSKANDLLKNLNKK